MNFIGAQEECYPAIGFGGERSADKQEFFHGKEFLRVGKDRLSE